MQIRFLRKVDALVTTEPGPYEAGKSNRSGEGKPSRYSRCRCMSRHEMTWVAWSFQTTPWPCWWPQTSKCSIPADHPRRVAKGSRADTQSGLGSPQTPAIEFPPMARSVPLFKAGRFL